VHVSCQTNIEKKLKVNVSNSHGMVNHLMPSILSLLCLSFPTQIPPVLILLINNPEKDPKVSISLNAK
jgi:hypothetical protein